jgi:hypothetical protein
MDEGNEIYAMQLQSPNNLQIVWLVEAVQQRIVSSLAIYEGDA